MVPSSVNNKFVIRFCVVAQHATEQDIGNFNYFFYFLMENIKSEFFCEYLDIAWKTISDFATKLLEKELVTKEMVQIVSRKRNNKPLTQSRSFVPKIRFVTVIYLSF